MTLLDLIPNLKRIGATNGGEWAGPCPFCGGNDRFRVWPGQGSNGRYWCRRCEKTGDAITILREREGLSFREACLLLGKSYRTEPKQTAWEPKRATMPGTTWQEVAASILPVWQRNLAGPSGADCREWLKGRGLHPETIERAGLGWNIADRFESREAWGLPPETKEDGRPRRVWLPAGLVIPYLAGGQVVRLRVRRPNPGDGSRYVIVSGSGMAPLTLGHGTVWVIVESELDALLLAQEAGDLVGIVALGSAQARPDQETHRALERADLILNSLDYDDPGNKEVYQWWEKIYRNVAPWPVSIGKDPTEAKQAGLNLRDWIMVGLQVQVNSTEMAVNPDFERDTAKDTASIENKAIEPIRDSEGYPLTPGQCEICPAGAEWNYLGPGRWCFHAAVFEGRSGLKHRCEEIKNNCPLKKRWQEGAPPQ